MDKTLISANAGTPYPKYFNAAAVISVSSLENEPYPNRPLIISSEAKTKPKLAGIENNNDVTLLASSPITKYQIFKYQNHAYGIQFHIEIKDTTVNEWGCVPEYKKALEDQLGNGALEKFDQSAKDNMKDMNNYSTILYNNFKKLL